MNPLEALALFDPGFQSQHSAKCDVLIRIDSKHIGIAIVDQLQDQLRALLIRPIGLNADTELSSIFEGEAVLKYHYRKIKVSMRAREFVFIPSEAYQQTLLPVYSAFMSRQDEIHVTHLRAPRIKNVTSLDPVVQQRITGRFVNAHFFSQADPFLDAFLKCHYKPMSHQLFIHFSDEVFDIALAEGKKILFYNVFENRTAEEFNYFLLLVLRQLKLTSGQVEVVVAGQISAGDERHVRLEKYFRTIGFAESGKLMKTSTPFAELETHRHFSLLGLNLCES